MRRGKKKKEAFLGFLIFFLTVSVAVTVAVLTYDWIGKISGSDGRIVTAVMFVVILALSALCAAIEYFRHKWTVENNVEEILEMTQRIAQGDFEARVTVRHSFSAYDDFDRIKENLNALAKELSKTELLRSDFISSVSHEIKTPLSVIRSYALALEKGGMDEVKRKKYVKVLVEASDKLTALITNILRLNKLENAEVLPELKRLDATACLQECVLGFEEAMEEKKIKLEFAAAEGIFVYAPEGFMELVWNNLLSNAVKFTDEGGKISVTMAEIGDSILVRVSDSGCGISPETGKRIFEKFYQGDASHAAEGNGLGLALVKKVIDLLGGEITVESVLGKGTAFTVLLRKGER